MGKKCRLKVRAELIPATHTDFISIYRFFALRILQKYRFSSLKFGKIQIFSGMRKCLLYVFFSHTDFFPKTLIFLVIYTDFVLDQSGRSVNSLVNPHSLLILL